MFQEFLEYFMTENSILMIDFRELFKCYLSAKISKAHFWYRYIMRNTQQNFH